MKKTLYQVLGVEPDATAEEIAAANSKVMQAFEAGSCDRNQWIAAREAFSVLSNPAKRALYDRARTAPVAIIPIEDDVAGPPWMKLAIGAVILIALLAWWRSKAPKVTAEVIPVAATTVVEEPVRQFTPAASGEPLILARPSAGAAPSAAMSGEQLFSQISPSIGRVVIMSSDNRKLGHGSGVVIGSDTMITNCHVAKAGPRLVVYIGQNKYDATVTIADEDHDLCQISVPGLAAPAVSIGSASNLQTGQKVLAIGAPLGLDLTISDGIVSSLRNIDGGTLIQTTAPVSPGSSGGGLFDTSGHLVGIVTFQATSGQNLNFAAPADWIATMKTRPMGAGLYKRLAAADPGENTAGQSSPSESVIGSWHCYDVIGGTSIMFEFQPQGRLVAHVGDKGANGRWDFDGRRLSVSISLYSSAVNVESWSESKMVLFWGKGVRTVCTRQ